MISPRKSVPWVVVGAVCVPGVFTLGCGGCCCADYLIEVVVSSVESLLLDDAELDTVARPPTLIAGIEPSDPDYTPVVIPLTSSADNIFTLQESFTLVGMWPDTDVDVEAGDFALSFELEHGDVSDTGDDGLSPFTQQGGADEIELWNGWTLDLDWGEPTNWCK
jgi:hypothetical protein